MEGIKRKKSVLSNSLGNLSHLEKFSHGINGVTDNGHFSIEVISKGVIRIRIDKEELEPKHSYAVINKTSIDSFNFEEDSDTFFITTKALVLKVSKSPVRFTFLTLTGEIINEDDSSFGTTWIGDQVTTFKKLQKDEKFVGLGEKTGPLNRKGQGYQNWNTDQFAYGSGTDPLYSTIPFYIGIHNNLVYGVFMDNSHKTHFNFGASNDRFSSFSADYGDMDYYFIHGETVGDIVSSYSDLTGKMTMPPLWSIGYQQCRYSYYPDKEVYTLANTFREKEIPADVIVFDIHYMEKYKIFTWDGIKFPDPKALIKYLKEKGFRVVVIFDPGIKIEEGYEPYESGIEEDIFIKYPDGEYYSGQVWPGWCHFPDFTNPKTRNWWMEKMKLYIDQGVEGYWNDMNEIATWGNQLPELMEVDFEGEKSTMREGRNVYGMQMARSSFEGAKTLLNGKRPFTLTRSGYAGIQRYSAMWTGDNVANDENMLLGVRLVNSLGLSGVPFAGYDVGGFVGNASEGLFARWIQLGTFSPFFRGHSMINSRDSEPWAYGEKVEEISRNFIRLRYKMMPYLYSSFYQANQTGLAISRSLVYNYPHDEKIYSGSYQNQYLFGDSFLVAPVESYKELIKVYLPEGQWYNFYTDEISEAGEFITESPIEQLPVFVKESAITVIAPNIGVNTADLGETLEFHVYNGEIENEFTYYEDDGETYQYETGDSLIKRVIFNPEQKSIEISENIGPFNSRFSKLEVVLHGFENTIYSVNGEKVESLVKAYKFINPISNFDPIGEESGSHLKIKEVKVLKLENFSVKNIIKY